MIKTLSKAQKMEREKFRMPRSVQDAIPIRRIFADGIFQVGNQYSKTWSFTDINYAIASKEDKTSIDHCSCAAIRHWWWTRHINCPMPPTKCTQKHYPRTTWMNCAFYYNRRTTRILPDICGRRSLRCRSPARRGFPSCEEKRVNRSCLHRSAALLSSTV